MLTIFIMSGYNTSIFTSPDSDDSNNATVVQIISSSSDSSDSDIVSACLELNECEGIDVLTKKLVSKYLEKAGLANEPEPQCNVDSSSESGQATMGTQSTNGCASGESSSADPSTTASVAGKVDDNSQSSASEFGKPVRRSVRIKSLSMESESTPSRSMSSEASKGSHKSSITSENSDHADAVETLAAKIKNSTAKTLEVRLQRMSIDMANLKVQTESSQRKVGNSNSDVAGPSPKKLRARTPSTKCLESFNLEDLYLSPSRRTSRVIKPSQRYAEYTEQSPMRNKDHRTPKKAQRNPSPTTPTDEEGLTSVDMEPLKKSSTLCDQDADVAGQQMFAFRTPKKRSAMAQFAAQAPKTPQTPKTPNHRKTGLGVAHTPKTPKIVQTSKTQPTKTPSRLRSILKKELAKFTQPETSGSDFSADESDEYKPVGESDSNSAEETTDNADEDSDEQDSPEEKKQSKSMQPKKYIPPVVANTASGGRLTRLSTRRQQDFVPESEDYFSHHASKNAVTSDRTLDRMKTPRLPHDHLFKLLASTSISLEHEKAITEMHQEYRLQFSKWLFTLNEGFNILLHGLGSKRNILQQFHEDVLSDQTVLVVNGFFPSLTIKDILDSISMDILELPVVSRNPHELVDAIAEALAGNPECHLFLIVHNIDGTMLRNDKAQLILSRLAKLDQVHLIASMDHINAPLLWDHIKLSQYNFSWWDVTTMLPYTEETAFENSMLVNNSGGLALSSMKNVFLSLTNNSRKIFLVIVKNQLNNKGNSNFQGMPFKDLYSRCREDFLVSTDVALRSQLTEFIDHHLVKIKRTSDGIEHVIIPLDAGLLQQFLELQENND